MQVTSMTICLYHGSDTAIEHPDVSRNTGFSDLGQGFYLTDDHDAARRRARSRAHRTGSPTGVISVFELDETCVEWVSPSDARSLCRQPFGLRFDETEDGLTSWIEYIKDCRQGKTAVGTWGEPAIVRAWIATEEIEMACAGFVAAEELAGLISADELIVQYCLRDQHVVDEHLRFVEAEPVE